MLDISLDFTFLKHLLLLIVHHFLFSRRFLGSKLLTPNHLEVCWREWQLAAEDDVQAGAREREKVFCHSSSVS